MFKNKGFTLIEILLAVTLLATLISVAAFNFNSLSESAQYREAKENLKTYLISQKYRAAYEQKEIEVDVSKITNDFNIVDASKIIFFSDGSIEESYIIISSLDGKYTNKLIINVIGYVSEQDTFEIPPIESKDRLPLETYE
jgi:type IV fimbrial biogenesis protein FimT